MKNTKKRTAQPASRGKAWGQDDARPEKAQNGRRHKKKRGHSLKMLYLTILFMMLTVGAVLIFTVFFKVLQMDTKGVTHYDEQDVLASSGIVLHENMFRLPRQKIEEQLVQKYSYFEKVHIRLLPPDALTIEVTEAVPWGVLEQGEEYLLFSQAGRVLERVAQPPEGLPRVKGMEAFAVQTGGNFENAINTLQEQLEKLREKHPGETAQEAALREAQIEKQSENIATLREKWTMLRLWMQACTENNFLGTSTVDVSDKYNLLVEYQNRITMEFGSEAELSYKLQCVCKVLESDLDSGFEGHMDASSAGKVRTRRIPLEAQKMSETQYAEYLYAQSGGVPIAESSSQSAASAPATQPSAAASSSQSEKPLPSATDEVLGEEISEKPEQTQSEDEQVQGEVVLDLSEVKKDA